MLSNHLVTAIAAALAASGITATLLAAPREPRLMADYAPAVPRAALDSEPLPRHLNAPATREKQAAPGVCDYPDNRDETGLTYFHPCWCGDGQTHGAQRLYLSTCESAEAYLNDVQVFGAPRMRVPLPE